MFDNEVRNDQNFVLLNGDYATTPQNSVYKRRLVIALIILGAMSIAVGVLAYKVANNDSSSSSDSVPIVTSSTGSSSYSSSTGSSATSSTGGSNIPSSLLPESYNYISNRMQSFRNATVDPCDDFYQYACGNFNHAIDPSVGYYIAGFSDIESQVNKEIASILQDNFPLITTAYQSCKQSVSGQYNATNIDQFQPWLDLIDKVTDASSLLYTIGQMDRHMLFTKLISFKNEDFALWLGNGYANQLSISLSPTYLNYYDGVLTKFIQLIDPTVNAADIAKGVSDMANQIFHIAYQTSNDYSATMNYTDLLANTSLPINSYFLGFSKGGPVHGLGQPIDMITKLYSRPIKLAKPSASFQQIYTEYLSPSTLNITLWKYFLKVGMYTNAVTLLPTAYYNVWCTGPNSQYKTECRNPYTFFARGSTSDVDAVCNAYVSTVFSNLLVHIWLKEDYPTTIQNSISKLVDTLYSVLGSRIQSNEWLDADTRDKAIQKWAKIALNVGFNDNFQQYLPLDVAMIGDPVWDLLAAVGYFQGSNSLIINQAVNRTQIDSRIPLYIQNAFYQPLTNSINMIPGLQFQPMFDVNFPTLFNIASYGWVIGHEMVHGFDSSGRNYDGDGQKINWWSNSSTQAFTERAQCMISQYSNYTFGTGKVDGEKTLGENIADNGGLGVAYDTYKAIYNSGDSRFNLTDSVLKQAVLDQLSQDFNLSYDQLFFLWAGQVWCGVFTPSAAGLLLKYDVHSPTPLRLTGSFSNFPQFAQAYNCPATSKMGRSLTSDRCQVW